MDKEIFAEAVYFYDDTPIRVNVRATITDSFLIVHNRDGSDSYYNHDLIQYIVGVKNINKN